MELPRETLLNMMQQMVTIRKFEEQVADFLNQGKIHGTGHLYIGQEAVAVGACAAIRPEDYITSTHRGHGHCIAKGADIKRMMAELFGKETGYCRGKGGSMHIADVEKGNLGANGVVGGSIGIATGAGLTIKMKGWDRVVLCFFGDGALNQGIFHEAVNLASVWQLPVVYIAENNLYAMSTATSIAFNITDFSERAKAYGIPGVNVDGNDVLAVHRTIRDMVARARAGEGPSLVIAHTYRWKGHSRSDAERYRTRDEVQQWKEKCPIRRFRDVLTRRNIGKEPGFDRLEEEVAAAVQDAVAFAQDSPFPASDTLEDGVYGCRGEAVPGTGH